MCGPQFIIDAISQENDTEKRTPEIILRAPKNKLEKLRFKLTSTECFYSILFCYFMVFIIVHCLMLGIIPTPIDVLFRGIGLFYIVAIIVIAFLSKTEKKK